MTPEEFKDALRRSQEMTSAIGSTAQSAMQTLQGVDQPSPPGTPELSKVLVRPPTPLFDIFSREPSPEPPAQEEKAPPPRIVVQEAQDEAVINVPQVIMPYLPLDVALPRGHMLRFRPAPSDVFDSGNGELFHPGFLSVGGRRRRVAIPGGLVYIRPKHVKIVVTRKSYGTRQELTAFIRGRFPVGGVIDRKTYSSARLPFAALAKLPGTVTITY